MLTRRNASFKFNDRAVIETDAEDDIAKAVVVIVATQAIAHVRHDADIEPSAFWCLIGVFAASLDAGDKLLPHYGGLTLRLFVHFVEHFPVWPQHCRDLPVCVDRISMFRVRVRRRWLARQTWRWFQETG